MERLKQAGIVLVLLAAAVGFLGLIGSSHRRSFDQLRARLPGDDAEVQLTVDHSACRYLFPGPADLVLGRLVCRSCLADASLVHERYAVRRAEARCGGRGVDTLWFQRRAPTP